MNADRLRQAANACPVTFSPSRLNKAGIAAAVANLLLAQADEHDRRECMCGTWSDDTRDPVCRRADDLAVAILGGNR